jgi:hypothetical protein
MNIGNLTGGSVAAAVWTASVRSLTVDPATDAGAATLVWTHASRSLTVDPATDAGAATLVWTHATRSLTVDPATDAGAATLVWTHATRTLTSLNNVAGLVQTGQSSVANNALVDLRSGASSKLREINITASNVLVLQYYDGTNFLVYLTGLGSGANGGYGLAGNTVGLVIKNLTGIAQNYMYMFTEWTLA